MPTLPAIPTLQTQIEDFRGPWTRLEPSDVPADQALLSLNGEYNPGQVSTRFGFPQFWNAGDIFTTLFNWIKAPDLISTLGNYLVFYNQTSSKVQWASNLLSPAETDLYDLTGAEGVVAVSHGNQLMLAGFTSGAVGRGQLRVVQIFGAAFDVDKGFLGPLTDFPNLVESGTGTITPGLHSIGYVITSRDGFTGKVCPVTEDGLFDMTSNIVATGGKQISVQLTASYPLEAEGVQIVMSTAANPARLFAVPGAHFAVPGGAGPYTFALVLDISDQQLVQVGTDLTDNQFFLTQDADGNGPFNPFFVFEYGNRVGYLTYDGNGSAACYMSEVNNPQQLTEDFNKLKLPGWRQMTSAFVLRGLAYILGPHWTFSFQDTGDVPVLWAAPRLIDGEIGTPSILGTVVNASGDWAAVVSISGLYVFNGQYQDKPISYMVDPDWRRINFAGAAQTIRITDNKDKKELVVAVPLDDALTPSHLMMFDYSDGLTAETVKYSLWNIASQNPRGLCTFQNPSTSRMEFLTSTLAGKVCRQANNTDDGTNAWVDVGNSTIQWSHQIAPQPDGEIGVVYAHNGAYVRAAGSGVLQGTAYTLDNQKSAQWSRPIALQANPGVEYFRQFYLLGERCSILFTVAAASTQTPGAYAVLSGYRHQFYQYALRRS